MTIWMSSGRSGYSAILITMWLRLFAMRLIVLWLMTWSFSPATGIHRRIATPGRKCLTSLSRGFQRSAVLFRRVVYLSQLLASARKNNEGCNTPDEGKYFAYGFLSVLLALGGLVKESGIAGRRLARRPVMNDCISTRRRDSFRDRFLHVQRRGKWPRDCVRTNRL